MKPNKVARTRRLKGERVRGALKEYNRGSELVQSTLYIAMELSQ
jgi:hypothetical protein